MKATEYNKIDSTYFLIEEKTKNVCRNNGIDIYNYLGVFKTLLFNYIRDKMFIETVKELDFNDKISTRAILNKANFSTKENEICFAIENFTKSKTKLFNWLDNVEEPYFFILNPIFEYGAGIDYNSWFCKRYGYKKVHFTGSKNVEIACDYANYTMFGKKILSTIKK